MAYAFVVVGCAAVAALWDVACRHIRARTLATPTTEAVGRIELELDVQRKQIQALQDRLTGVTAATAARMPLRAGLR
jgi:hypothetical protein